MLFTFLINYISTNEYDSIQFCAGTKKEAVELFNGWCITDNNLDKPLPIKSAIL